MYHLQLHISLAVCRATGGSPLFFQIRWSITPLVYKKHFFDCKRSCTCNLVLTTSRGVRIEEHNTAPVHAEAICWDRVTLFTLNTLFSSLMFDAILLQGKKIRESVKLVFVFLITVSNPKWDYCLIALKPKQVLFLIFSTEFTF